MYYVVTTRVVKIGTGSTERFTPRTANRTSHYVSGPFGKRSVAERSASMAMGTHTCLAACVVGQEQVEAIVAKGESRVGMYTIEAAILEHARRFPVAAKAEA